MEALQSFAATRVATSADVIKPGEYCYIPKRAPIRTVETVTAEPPTGFFRRLVWLVSAKQSTKVTETPQWPEYDCVVMACPHCLQPIGTTKDHRIVSIDPLTLDKPLACAYSKPSSTGSPTIAFEVKDGTISTA